jgi:energy-coupling factor transporter ATP-binding protein EcfA2
MVDLFISYSRQDKEFVQSLHDALKASHYSAWVDWQDIAPTTEWWKEIEEGIEAAHTFIFVISKDSILSKYCCKEINYAAEHGKRLIPILRRKDFARSDMHPKISRHQWLTFQEGDDFEQSFAQLVKAIETDLDSEKQRTRLELKAIEWEQNQRDPSFLLRGAELEKVRRWIDNSITLQSPLTNLQEEYLHASKAKETESLSAELSLRKITPQEYKNRQALINKVNTFWIKGVLKNSLHGKVMIQLGLSERTDVVVHPWDMTWSNENSPKFSIPRETALIDLFDELGAGRSLLILGEPGSGKTTTLLALTKDLINRAQQDIDQPIPVVLNLSSWRGRRLELSNWIVEELNSKYQIPRKIGEIWVKEQKLLLLLDGLDEVQISYRNQCVQQINQFHRELSAEMVVCSRTEDYEKLTSKLELQSAVSIKPLNSHQIDHFLQEFGNKAENIRRILTEDHFIREMAQSPLMLSIMILAYQDNKVDNLPQGNQDSTRKYLFDTYIDKMLGGNTAIHPYTKKHILHWLKILAQQMMGEGQTVFLIEHMQPTWLSKVFQRLIYVVTLGFLLSTILTIIFLPTADFFVGLVGLKSVPLLSVAPLSLVIGLFWSVAALKLQANLVKPKNRCLLGLFSGIFATTYIVLFSGSLSALSVLVGLGYGTFVCLISAFISYRIKPAENFEWSWKEARKGLTGGLRWGIWIGLIFGFMAGVLDNVLLSQIQTFGTESLLIEASPVELVNILTYGWPLLIINCLVFALIFEVLGGVVGSLISGYSATSVKSRAFPNQGIWQSAQNCLIFSVLGAICTGFLFSSLGVPFVPSALLGLLFGLVTAGIPCLQHLMLRIILAIWGNAPWNYAKFLDFSTRHILLQKVGGGYIFLHRLLLEHFVELKL